MRKPIMLASLATLAACGGGGPQTAGGTAVTGGGSSGSSNHSFVTPTEAKTYSAIGGAQSYRYSTDERGIGQYNQLYAGNASTARNSGITIAYDPRDAIFELTVRDTAGNIDQSIRFQDPAHRTNFGGAAEPQDGTPNITGQDVRYLEVGNSSGLLRYDLSMSDTFPVGENGGQRNVSTFFHKKPGTTTQYVTYAGFIRNQTSAVDVENPDNTSFLRQDHVLERAAFVFGERTSNSNVPRTGTASYTGDMIATMVYNPLIDAGVPDTYFQWITGTATNAVDFGTNQVTSTFTGTVDAPQFDIYTSRVHVLDAGATFSATGTSTIDLVNKGGFQGQVGSASFTQGGSNLPVAVEGSSIDGAFFGPSANEVGGGFRIVGGTPDQRIDILGAFTGARP